MPSHAKLARWIDLVAALLRHRTPVSFERLAREVPAYADPAQRDDARLRMFERDKDELRALGLPIESKPDADGATSRYQLRGRDFYLPFLVLADAVAPGTVEARVLRGGGRPDGPGYGELATLAVAPEHLVLLRRAAARVLALGEARLSADATAALRKLRFDLQMLEPPDTADVPHGAASAAHGAHDFGALVQAIERRKHVRFRYHSIGRDETRERVVAPYGLVFRATRWYLVARDVEAADDGPRLFRLSRLQGVTVNARKPHAPDFAVPADFDLAAHAETSSAWTLGDGAAEAVDVAFAPGLAGEMARQALGEPIAGDGDGDRRRFEVRRRDVFLRWLLGFAGEARPVAPPAVVAAWRDLVAATHARHTATAGAGSGEVA